MEFLLFNQYPEPDENGRVPLGGERLARIDKYTVKINTASGWWVLGCTVFTLACAAFAALLSPLSGDLRWIFSIGGFILGMWTCLGLFAAVVAADYREHVRRGGRVEYMARPYTHLLTCVGLGRDSTDPFSRRWPGPKSP